MSLSRPESTVRAKLVVLEILRLRCLLVCRTTHGRLGTGVLAIVPINPNPLAKPIGTGIRLANGVAIIALLTTIAFELLTIIPLRLLASLSAVVPRLPTNIAVDMLLATGSLYVDPLARCVVVRLLKPMPGELSVTGPALRFGSGYVAGLARWVVGPLSTNKSSVGPLDNLPNKCVRTRDVVKTPKLERKKRVLDNVYSLT